MADKVIENCVICANTESSILKKEYHMRFILPGLILFALSLPAAAQQIDFGDDASMWANDGQCDDKRFSGPGMTPTILLDSDIGHDATDCRTAFEAGLLELAAGGGQADVTIAPIAPSSGGFSSAPGSKTDKVKGGGFSTPPVAAEIIIDGIRFGDDSGPVSNDGECDDRRFAGAGMAQIISWENLGRDASDCVAAYQAGTVYLWVEQEAQLATSCQAIDFGDDSGEYPNDYECDDYRFEGRGVAMNLLFEAAGTDASDCSRLCDYGLASLRDYR